MQGGCLCGGVRFEFAEPVQHVFHCHCADCRRIAGAHATVGVIDAGQFRVIQGTELIGVAGARAGRNRYFCARCGCQLFSRWPARPDLVVAFAGALDDGASLRPEAHIWTSCLADWERISDGLPCFEGHPTARTAGLEPLPL